MSSAGPLGDVHVGNHDSLGICSRCLMAHATPEAERLCVRASARIDTAEERTAFRDLVRAIRAERLRA